MTRAEVRQAIATAASTVDGITCEAYYKPSQKVGWAWVEHLRTEYPNRLGGQDYWAVCIIAPNDAAAAQTWQDGLQEPAVVALMEELDVTSARPDVLVQTDNASIKVLIIEGNREGER